MEKLETVIALAEDRIRERRARVKILFGVLESEKQERAQWEQEYSEQQCSESEEGSETDEGRERSNGEWSEREDLEETDAEVRAGLYLLRNPGM